ncbi:precorrin-6A synthase (deacetylating) [Amycolatopsis albispora]|uniref:Precorrin-6A synthase (Deacetylating) n=1 Tax=Amycolatopsis albispora TaxID=1804986 RepID=A0A344LHE7_9PSEU|nr:precorrin-6A synthase (deacetylating) [Amycolatopsis albispora]AXB47471.1 precorrin-6A synthase (deacetylating) [Amycolatopsis albispora]
MRKISVIGIGAGDPDQLTVQAIREIERARVFFVLDKGEAKRDLVALREGILAKYGRDHRVVHAQDPPRDRQPEDYRAAVAEWHRLRVTLYARLIRDELPDDGHGAFLVWGDPALYDSTITLVEAVSRELDLDYSVIPGVSSVSTLAARHRIPLNRIGEPVQFTTGRRLAEDRPGDAVVLLDANCTFQRYYGEDLEIFWGAYLGTPDEILLSGPLAEIGPEIERRRAEARAEKGWIMDTYLLRSRP